MPILGILAACLANCIPIGGGIVYVPLLNLIGENINLSVSFTLATMTIGNGIFGFFHWLLIDHSLIVWESFVYTVFPCWIGSYIGIIVLPHFDTYWVRKGFGTFCFLVAIYIFHIAKLESNENKPYLPFEFELWKPLLSMSVSSKWMIVSIVSFLSGLILVTNIGIGPALITFFLLKNMLGYSRKQSIVTGIITGGWVCFVPFLIHLLYLHDIPFDLWIMVLPGVYFGAQIAPKVYDHIGLNAVFFLFGWFLILSSIMFCW
jgi:uncharacterized membrane protein YfcA